MIFKIGLFVFLCGVGIPIYNGADHILWASRHKEALRQYWIRRAEGKPLDDWMKSAYSDYVELCICGVVVVMGLILMLAGYIFGI